MVAHLSVLLVVLLSAGVSGGCTLLGPEELPGVSNWQNGGGAPKEVSGVLGTTGKSTRACLREGDMPVPDEMLVCGAAIGRLICWLSRDKNASMFCRASPSLSHLFGTMASAAAVLAHLTLSMSTWYSRSHLLCLHLTATSSSLSAVMSLVFLPHLPGMGSPPEVSICRVVSKVG
jgi:hypothetical protein